MALVNYRKVNYIRGNHHSGTVTGKKQRLYSKYKVMCGFIVKQQGGALWMGKLLRGNIKVTWRWGVVSQWIDSNRFLLKASENDKIYRAEDKAFDQVSKVFRSQGWGISTNLTQQESCQNQTKWVTELKVGALNIRGN